MKTDNITPLKNPVFVTRSSMPSFKEYCDEIKGIWESHHLTNMGPKHNRLVQKLSEYLNIPSVSLYANGHLALENMLEAYKVSGEVITTPFTFVSTTNALVRKGLKPVFCDIKKDDYTIDPSKIEALITEKTSAILAVHVYGHVCDDQAISDIAQKYDLKVFYDAAHAFGVLKKGASVAALGDCSMFSFHATKVFNTIEGGALVMRDEQTKKRIDYLKNFGFINEVTVVGPGINSKMDEMRSAYGLLNLKQADAAIEARHQVAIKYREALRNVEGITFFDDMPGVKHNYSYFPIFIDAEKYGMTRDELYFKMKEQNVLGRRYFYPLISTFSTYRGLESAAPENLPNAHKMADQVICLPMHHALNEEDLERIITQIVK